MPSRFRAPGRVNLIGEHTDYNDGLVLPVALDLQCVAAAEPRPDGRVVCRSANADGELALDPSSLPARTGDWRDYVAGVVFLLRERRVAPGATLSLRSTVPLGAGLSSSAALEVAVAVALLDLAGVTMPLTDVAVLCQRAEHEFVGAACGIMDQYVACHARRGTALLLDCRTLTHRHLPLPDGLRIVVCDSGVRHAHADGEYNRRRSECRDAAAILGVASLRDLHTSMLPDIATRLDERLLRRVRHVVTENARVERFAAALEREDLAALKPIMRDSHESLRSDYEVSCTELDALVDVACAFVGVYGTRMTGGGFGGSTVNLVDADAVDAFREHVSAEYARRFGRAPGIYVSRAASGAGPLAESDDE
jgi:galactokinase